MKYFACIGLLFLSVSSFAEEKSFPIKGEISLALDDFRSLPEGSWEGNMGAFTSLYLSAFLPESFVIQGGGSYGLYDWGGRTSTPTENSDTLQQQGFVTGAFYRFTPSCSGVNFGFAYDWMLNKNFGVFAVNPFISQVRGQLGYLIQRSNEVGVWATIDAHTSHQENLQIPLTYRAISQVNLFWCYYFKNHAYTMIWAGTPYRRGLMYRSGRAGNYIFGVRFSAPLAESLTINGHAAYMGARSAPNGNESRNYASNVSLSITYAFGRNKKCATPYMSLADNTNFLVDTNLNQ